MSTPSADVPVPPEATMPALDPALLEVYDDLPAIMKLPDISFYQVLQVY